MIWTITEENYTDKLIHKHPGGKAREDLRIIFLECGFAEKSLIVPQRERAESNSFIKIYYHAIVAREWNKVVEDIQPGDHLVLQFPLINHTLIFNSVLKKLKKKGVITYAFIHDLEYLRLSNYARITKKERWRMAREELDELRVFDGIIAHNDRMKEYMVDRLGLSEDKIKTLGIFDYLTDDEFSPFSEIERKGNCIIAGNFMRDKAAFVYKLPQEPDFELYGINYEGNNNSNVHYHGSYYADELPAHLRGDFGLVWDGDSIDSCRGVWGEYLRFNNPHKTSLYLACGIPVIIWEEAALANFVKDNGVGITIKSLNDIQKKLKEITDSDYFNMKRNAIDMSIKIREGGYTKDALNSMIFRQGII